MVIANTATPSSGQNVAKAGKEEPAALKEQSQKSDSVASKQSSTEKPSTNNSLSSALTSRLNNVQSNNPSSSTVQLTTDKQLFKLLPARLQGLFALGLISTHSDAKAKVVASSAAEARQVQLLLPLLKQDKSFSSAELIKQPPTLLKLDLAGHQIITVTKEPVSKGEWVKLRLNQQGQLILSQPTNATGQPSNGNVSTLTKSPQLTIQQALREALPSQQNLDKAIGQIQRLHQSLTLLPPKHNLINANSRMIIQQLAEKLPSLQQLGSSNVVKQSVQNNGIQHEQQLAKLAEALGQFSEKGAATSAQPNIIKGLSVSAPLSDLKTQLLRLAQSLKNDVQLSRLQQSIGQSAPSSKGASSPDTSSSSQNQTSKLHSNLSPKLSNMLDLLLNPKNLEAKNQAFLLDQFKQLQGPQLRLLREQLKQKLISISQAGVAKIQTQQLSSLSEAANGVVQRWLMELPFSHQGQIHSIELEIQQREAKKQSEEQKAVKQWQLRLNIDLMELGALQADIKLHEQQSNIQLWFDQADTQKLALSHINHLKDALLSKGLDIEELRCHQGIPPKLENKLQFQLINTKA
ncbi:flagellar hook-length control protein FliK [uncultured Pseudoteredinibacter sp.]|uniref:flagellar hook-length control protein FliK n=1 Tax=uncultured Pseudoteredinibacter sp. TaxID=1641701 RepID=UPI0026389012|nr:flagellar hook-length control protein FliK [uncultured Pseudoteredinibacter sp.]